MIDDEDEEAAKMGAAHFSAESSSWAAAKTPLLPPLPVFPRNNSLSGHPGLVGRAAEHTSPWGVRTPRMERLRQNALRNLCGSETAWRSFCKKYGLVCYCAHLL